MPALNSLSHALDSPGAFSAVRLARRPERAALSEVLSRAFEDEAWMSWLIEGGLGRRRRRLLSCMEIFLQTGGQLFTTDDLRGAALWHPPGTWKLSFFFWLRIAASAFRIVGPGAMVSRLLGLWRVASLHPPEPHYYLLIVGTDPPHQGQGVGTSLLRPVLRLCDSEGMPAYLETSEEKNLSFYRHLGFSVMRKLPSVSPLGGGPPVWLMWRLPQDPVA